MQTDDLENQVSNHTALLQYLNHPVQASYRPFTTPIREDANCGKEVEKGGLLSNLPTASPLQLPANQVIISSDISSSKTHQNGHSHQQQMDKIISSPIFLPALKAPVQTYTKGYAHGLAHREVTMKRKGSVIVAYLSILLMVIGVILYYVFTFNLFAPAPSTQQAFVQQKHLGSGELEDIHRVPSAKALQTATTSKPWGVAIDSLHHLLWVAEPGCEPKPTCLTKAPGILGQYNQFDGSWIQDFPEPPGYTRPAFLALAADGTVWFTEPDSDAIGELDPQHVTWSQWTLSAGSAPFDLTFDTHGNLWFTEFDANAIGFFNPHTDKRVENPIPTAASNPYGITQDSRGTLWFTENRAGIGQIGSFTPTASGKIAIVEHKVTSAQPHLITADRQGNIWYSEAFGGSIGEYIPASGHSVDYPVSLGICSHVTVCKTHISGIAVDPEGDIWYSDSQLYLVGCLIPSTGKVVTKTISNLHEGGSNQDDSAYDGLAVDGYNDVWFTETYSALLVMWPKHSVK